MIEPPHDLRYARAGTEILDDRASQTSVPVLVAALALVILPVIALCQFINYWRTDVVDDQMFGYFGWRIAHGARVYLDVWDNKPPGIYWINALGFLIGADSYLGVVAMCVLALLASFTCFFLIGASVWYRGAAALATILFSFYLTHGYYTGGTNRTETFVVAFELGAVLCYLRGFAHDRWWKWLLAGALCGVAFTFKQVGLAAWGAMGLHLIWLVLSRQLAFRIALKRCLLLLSGCCATLAVVAAALAAQGALDDALFAAFGFNRQYFTAGASEFPYNYMTFKLLTEHHLMPIMRLPLLMAVAAVIHAVLWRFRPKHRPPEIEGRLARLQPVCPDAMLLFGVWYVVAMYGALLSPHGFRHYVVPTIPPLLLMGGSLINVLRSEVSLLRRLQQRAWVTAAFVLIGWLALDAFWYQGAEFSKVLVFRFMQSDQAEWEVVGRAIAAATRPDEKIQCWGYLPGVYLSARRENTCRFTTTEKIGHVGGGADFVLVELERKLKDDPPAALAMKSDDYYWLRGEDPLKRPPAVILGPWIDENYERIRDIPKFNVYVFKRKASPAAGR